jgi:hypothetical protein
MTDSLLAGAARVDITPRQSLFLFGYPHVPRHSTGTHDPLLATALFLQAADRQVLLLSADVIFVTKALTQRVRERIERETGIPGSGILIAATHTHSGPVTVDYVSNQTDPIVPRVDPQYLRQLEDGLTTAAVQAWQQRRAAEWAFARADATGIGTCRHDPRGPADLSVPVLSVRDASTAEPIALMMVCAMHPTVLHEDSTLYSGDFPAFARSYLQTHVLGKSCPVVYFTGASGDQSPRHVTRANTFAEAERLDHLLGRAVEDSLAWPGEFFVEFALAVRRQAPNAHVITLANGELQGYVVTQQAVDGGWYEAANAILQSPESGDRIVEATLRLLAQSPEAG